MTRAGLLLLVALAGHPAPVHAADPPGSDLPGPTPPPRSQAAGLQPPGAQSCASCHAATSPMGNLQGRPAEATIAAMEAFRSGARPATLMNRIAKGFTQDEVRAIATWFAAS